MTKFSLDVFTLSGFGTLIAAVRSSIITSNPRVPCPNFAGGCVLRQPLWPAFPDDGVGFLLGDFNICDPDEGRLNSWNQTLSNGDAGFCIAAAAILAGFPHSVEVAQPNFTRKDERRDGSVHTAIAC